jgi:hypothetical protein
MSDSSLHPQFESKTGSGITWELGRVRNCYEDQRMERIYLNV